MTKCKKVGIYFDVSIAIESMTMVVCFLFSMFQRQGRRGVRQLIILLLIIPGQTSQPQDTLDANVASLANDDISIIGIGDGAFCMRTR